MRITACLAALLLGLGACGTDDPTGRDYTAEACPSPVAAPDASPVDARDVCDRGRGYSPRFVTIEACLAELRLRAPEWGWGGRSTSPIYLRCRPGVLVYTLDDVRSGPGLVSY